MDDSRYNFLKNKFYNMIKISDYNNFGNLQIYVKNFNCESIKNDLNDFAEFIILSCGESLKISKKYNNNKYCAHIYLEGVSIKKSFSLSLFKKLYKKLDVYDDREVLHTCYVYSTNTAILNIIKIIRPFLHKETRNKFVLVK